MTNAAATDVSPGSSPAAQRILGRLVDACLSVVDDLKATPHEAATHALASESGAELARQYVAAGGRPLNPRSLAEAVVIRVREQGKK